MRGAVWCSSCSAENPPARLYCASCWAPLVTPSRPKPDAANGAAELSSVPERAAAPVGVAEPEHGPEPWDAYSVFDGACRSCGAGNPVQRLYCVECWTPLAIPRPARGTAAVPAAQAVLEVARPTDEVTPARAPVDARYSRCEAAIAYAGVAAALAVAVVVRFYRLGDVPSDPIFAEEVFRQAAVTLRNLEGGVGFWTETTNGQPPGVPYMMAAWMLLFDSGILGLRLLFALVGLASVAIFFLAARAMFGQRPAVLGSLLLALNVWHLSYSRLALATGPLLVVDLIAIYILFLALEEGRDLKRQRRLLISAGLAFGAGAYYHNAFFIFALAVLVLWARELLAGELPLGTVARRAAAFFFPALLVALPLLGFAAGDPRRVVEEVRSISVSRAPEYAELDGITDKMRHVVGNVARNGRAVFWERGDPQGTGTPARLLDPATAVLAVGGLIAALWRWRRREYAFLWVLVATGVVAAGLTRDAGVHARLLVVLPALFAGAGIALDGLLVSMWGRVPNKAALAVVGVLIVYVAAHNLSSLYRDPVSGNEALWVQSEPRFVGDRPRSFGTRALVDAHLPSEGVAGRDVSR